VESESRKIGTVQLPDALLDAMRAAPCIRVVLPRPLRIELLKAEYAHFFDDQDALSNRLSRLVPLHGKKTVAHWLETAKAGDWDALVSELLEVHYDPMYRRSIDRNFPRIADALDVEPSTLGESGFRALARELDARVRGRVTA
jgi:tRNA 2-selenouridine synthase